mmetsp:Transcript_5897/g.21513  ORF Transcript_5897/g.21513 Transcript_5897/m.21513 type:complete len:209 (+) Transcript_5897:407-1033(+)
MQKIEHRAVRSVDRHERPLQKAPVVALEVRDVHVRVLQPRVQNEPEVTHEVRAHVERDDGPDASGGDRPRGERGDDGDAADVALPHLRLPLPREQRELPLLAHEGQEVVRLPSHGPAAGAGEEVDWPPQEEDADEVQRGERPFAEQRAELKHDVRVRGVDPRRDVRLALHDVVRPRVVHRVRALPREVRHEQRGVQDVSHDVLHEFVL